ncbi:MAG: DUF4349 domain-containing protein [Defluviitaleaceae bacterium]|nr:DUF4349 domain-containing protein [Defluviitaleaceae bacterium]
MKRRMAVVCLIVLFLLAVPMQVSADARRLGQRYSVTLLVECLDTAVEAMRALPGFDLYMSISQYEAHYVRQVDAVFFRHAQAVLRDVGEVMYEQEHVRHLGMELMQLDTRITVLTQEMERLTLLMAASTTIDVLNAVDIQLTHVSRDRDWHLGRRNVLMNESQTVAMDITLTERWVPAEREHLTFGRRIRNSFMGSWNGLTRMGGDLVVLLARVGLPLMIWLAIAGTITLVVVRVTKKRSAVPMKGVEAHE